MFNCGKKFQRSSLFMCLALSTCLLQACNPGDLERLFKPADSDRNSTPNQVMPEAETQGKPSATPSGGLQIPSPRPSLFRPPGQQSPIPVLASASPGDVIAILPDLYNTRMPFNFGSVGAPMIGRRHEVYAGPTGQFALEIAFKAPLPETSGNGLLVKSGSGQVLRNLRNSNTVLVNGNVAILELNWDGTGEKPDIQIMSLGKKTSGGTFPAKVTALGDQVKSMPVTLNQPIEVFSNPGNQAQLHFFTVTGVQGKDLDIIADGPSTVYVNHESRGFFFPNEGAAPDERIDHPQDKGFVHIPASQQDTLLVTLETPGNHKEALHTRFSVNEVKELVDLTVRFPRPPAEYGMAGPQTLLDQMTEIAKYASLSLYQITAGHTRIRNLKVLLGQAQPLAKIDVRVDSNSLASDFIPEHSVFGATPFALIELEKKWWLRFNSLRDHPGFVLAHELIHHRYAILDEYVQRWNIDEQLLAGELNLGTIRSSTNYCPNSVMSCSVAEFCWQGNHNPTGDQIIASRFDNPLTPGVVEKNSSWDLYAFRVGVAPPNHHPPLILKDIKKLERDTQTTVVLPVSSSIETGTFLPELKIPVP